MKHCNMRNFTIIIVTLFVIIPVFSFAFSLFKDHTSHEEPGPQIVPNNNIDDEKMDPPINITAQHGPNGTHYILSIQESISIPEVAVIATVISSVSRSPPPIQGSSSEDLRKRKKLQFILRLVKAGISKSLKKIDRCLNKSGQKPVEADDYQYSPQFYLLKSFSLYPKLLRTTFLPLIVIFMHIWTL
jgi:hypothetical protein